MIPDYHSVIELRSLLAPLSLSALRRRWEAPPHSAGLQPLGGGATFDFSVMSYNILSQELLQDNAYLYRHCDPAVLHWNHRLPNLLAEIQQHDADVSPLAGLAACSSDVFRRSSMRVLARGRN